MGRRKEELERRRIDTGELVSNRSLHADGMERHTRGRLWDRQWRWSSIQHSGVSLQPTGQLHGASTVLGQHRSCPNTVTIITPLSL